MVLVESTKISSTPYIIEGVDHGETIVNIPIKNIKQGKMIEALIKL